MLRRETLLPSGRNVPRQLEEYIDTGFGYWRDLYQALPIHIGNLRNCRENAWESAAAELRNLLRRCGESLREKIAEEAGLDAENPDDALEAVRCLGRLCASALAAIALRQATSRTADAARMEVAWNLLVEAWGAWRRCEALPADTDWAPALELHPPAWAAGANAAALWEASGLGLELAFRRWAAVEQRPSLSVRTPVVLLNPKGADYDEQVELFVELYEHRDPARRFRPGLWLTPEQALWPLSGEFVKTVANLHGAIVPEASCMWGIRSQSGLMVGYSGKSHGAGVAALFDALKCREEVDPSVPVFGIAERAGSGVVLKPLSEEEEDSERRKIIFAVRHSIGRVVVIRAGPEPSRFHQGTHVICAESIETVRAALRHDLVREGYLQWVVQWSSQTKVEVKTNGTNWYAPLKHVYSVPEFSWGQAEELRLHRKTDGAGWFEPQADVNQAQSSRPNGASSLASLHPASVVLGDPGTGKSMLLYWLAQQHALTALQSGLKSKVRVAAALSGGDSSAADLILGPARLPIFVSLQEYPEWLEKTGGTAKTLDAWLYSAPGPTLSGIARYPDLHPHQGREISPADRRKLIEDALDRGECLILLDGLDELALVEMRAEVKSLVEAFIMARQGAGNRIVMTSRRVGYEAAQIDGTVRHALYRLPALEPSQSARFLADWSRTYCEANPEWDPSGSPELRATRLKDQLSARLLNDLSDLARTPLRITLLAKMYVERGGLPGSRLELYEKLVEQHLDLRRSAFQVLPELPLSSLDLLSEVVAGLRAKTTSPMFGIESWNDVCESVLQAHGVMNRNHRTAWASALREQGGLLVHSGTAHLAFAHQSFGEFLAGRGLFIGTPQQVIRQLDIRIADPFWREALTLGLAWCSRRQPENDFREILTALLKPDPQARLVESGALLATEAFRAAGAVRPWAIRIVAMTLASAWSALGPDERTRALALTYLEALGKLEQLRAGTVEEIALDWLGRQSAPAAANAAELCQQLHVVSDAIGNAVFRATDFEDRTTGFSLDRALRRLLSLNSERPPSVRGLRFRQFLLDNKDACGKLMASPALLRSVFVLYGGYRDEGAFEAWNRYRERHSGSIRGAVSADDGAICEALKAHMAKGASFSHVWIHRESRLTDLLIEALGHADPVGWFRTACDLLSGEQKAAGLKAELWRTVSRLWSAADKSGRSKLRVHALAALVALDGWSPELQDRINAACKDELVRNGLDAALTMAHQDLQEAVIRQFDAIENHLPSAGRADGPAFEAAVLSLLWIAQDLDLPVLSPRPLFERLSDQEKSGRIGSLVSAWMAWHAVSGVPPLDEGKSKHLAAGVIYALAVTWDKCFEGATAYPSGVFALNKLLLLPAWSNRFGHANPRLVFDEHDAIREAAMLLPIFRAQNRFLFYLALHHLLKNAGRSGNDIRSELAKYLNYVAPGDVAELLGFIQSLDGMSPAEPAEKKAVGLDFALDSVIEQPRAGVWEAGVNAFRVAREIGQANTRADAATLIRKASRVPMPILVPLFIKLVAELVDWGKLVPKYPAVACDLLDFIWACRQLRHEAEPDTDIIRLRPDFEMKWRAFAAGLSTPSLKTLALGQHGPATEPLGLDPLMRLAGDVCDAIDNVRAPGIDPGLASLWAQWPAEASARDALLHRAVPHGLVLTPAAAAALTRACAAPGAWDSFAAVAAWIYRIEPKLEGWVRNSADTGPDGLRDFAGLLLAEAGDWSPAVLESLRNLMEDRNELLSGRAYLALSLCLSDEQALGRVQMATFQTAAAASGKAATPAMNNIWRWFLEQFRVIDPEVLCEWIETASKTGEEGESAGKLLGRIGRLDWTCGEVVQSNLQSALQANEALAMALLKMLRNVVVRNGKERKFWIEGLTEELQAALDIPALQPLTLRIVGHAANMQFVPKLRGLLPEGSTTVLLDQALGRLIAEAGSEEEKASEGEGLWHQLSVRREDPWSCVGLLTSYLRLRGATVAEAVRVFSEGWDALYVCAGLISQDDSTLWGTGYRESVAAAGEFLHHAFQADPASIDGIVEYVAELIREDDADEDPPPHRHLDRWLQTLAEFGWRSPEILAARFERSTFPWREKLMEVTRTHRFFTARQSAIKLVGRTRLVDSGAVQALTASLLDVHYVAEEARRSVGRFSKADSGGLEGLEEMLLKQTPRVCLTAAELLMRLAADPTLGEDERRERRARAERLILERLSKVSPQEWTFYIPRDNGQEKRFLVRPQPFAPLRSALRSAIVSHEGWVKQEVAEI